MLVWLYTILHHDLSVHTKELTAVFEKIFTPIKIRDLVLDSRVVMTAMGTRFTDNHLVNSKHIAYHVARAKGGCTLNMVEVSGVHDGSDAIMFLSLARDEYVPEMKRLVDAIHEVGGKCGIQLYQGGLGVCFDSDAAMLVPDAMSLEDIHEVRIAFGEAARRAVEAGFEKIQYINAYRFCHFTESYTIFNAQSVNVVVLKGHANEQRHPVWHIFAHDFKALQGEFCSVFK